MEVTQTPRKKIINMVVGLVITLVLIGTYYVFDQFYPKAPKNFEFVGNLSNAQLDNGEETLSLNDDAFYKLLLHLYQAKPTRQMSVNDHPTVGNYYKIDFDSDFNQFSQRLYLYEYGGQVYFEIPYCGIYKTDQGPLTLLQGML